MPRSMLSICAAYTAIRSASHSCRAGLSSEKSRDSGSLGEMSQSGLVIPRAFCSSWRAVRK